MLLKCILSGYWQQGVFVMSPWLFFLASQPRAHPHHRPLFWFKCLLSTKPVSTPVLECWVTFLCRLLFLKCFFFLMLLLLVQSWDLGLGQRSLRSWDLSSPSFALLGHLKGFKEFHWKSRGTTYMFPHLLNNALLTSKTFSSLYLDKTTSHGCANVLDREEIHLQMGSRRCLL